MRCELCRKKKTLEFECKCTKKFCLDCLPSDVHKCTYNYKANKQEILSKTIVEAKFVKIDDI
jgi:hypothetical protein